MTKKSKKHNTLPSFKTVSLFLLIAALLLFYPGDNPYFQIVAFNRETFSKDLSIPRHETNDVPYTQGYAPFVTADGVYVVELSTFTPVLAKNEHKKLFPASTNKIITALVTLDLYKPIDIVKVKRTIQEGQLMDLVIGERITVENLLYGMLVHSGNDAAYAIAYDYGYDAFIDAMNKKAWELGMKDSQFRNPAGLDEANQLTTPFDLAVAARALLQNDYLRKIVGTKEIVISDVDYTRFHTLKNVNQLLGEIQGLGGLKTGYTELAGENLVSYFRYNNKEYIIVVMKSEDRFEDTRVILDWIKSNVKYISVQ
ncbi:D-alanyl-D-alanine carboxypeptidase [Candidatus Woesebacteria bacterium]|nr:D-alanyl-D-alanine carboxypeptidase [Candidatus Woesebacteria bacterium]